MNKNILVAFMIFSLTSYFQKYEAKKIIPYSNTNIDSLGRNEIYSLDKNELADLIRKSKKKYNLLLSFGTWCSPCREHLPALINFVKKNKEKINLYIINIEKDDSKSLFVTKQFFLEINYSTPTFMVSEKYGKDRRSKYKAFIKDVIGEKDFSDIYLGMFENILFDENFKIIYKSNDSDKDEVTLENINKIIKDD